jgi:hypothetical protein
VVAATAPLRRCRFTRNTDVDDQSLIGDATGRANAFPCERNNDALTAIVALNVRGPSCALHRCEEASAGLTHALMTWEAREGWPSRSSYFAARSNSRLLVNSSALSARLRQRAACSFKKELSTTSPQNATTRANFARHAVFFYQNMKHPPAQNLAYASVSDNSVSPSAISETIETSRFASPISQMSVPGALFGHRSDDDERPLGGKADPSFILRSSFRVVGPSLSGIAGGDLRARDWPAVGLPG